MPELDYWDVLELCENKVASTPTSKCSPPVIHCARKTANSVIHFSVSLTLDLTWQNVQFSSYHQSTPYSAPIEMKKGKTYLETDLQQFPGWDNPPPHTHTKAMSTQRFQNVVTFCYDNRGGGALLQYHVATTGRDIARNRERHGHAHVQNATRRHCGNHSVQLSGHDSSVGKQIKANTRTFNCFVVPEYLQLEC